MKASSAAAISGSMMPTIGRAKYTNSSCSMSGVPRISQT